MAWTESGRFLKIFISLTEAFVRVARGEDIEELWNFSREESLFFWGRGGQRTKRLIAPSARRNRSDVLSFETCIEVFDSCEDPRGRISLVHLLIYFAQQFRRERVNGRTTRMILSDLRSPNSFANCSRACLNGRCARIGSTLNAYSISSRRSFDIIRMERALPLLSCYNY